MSFELIRHITMIAAPSLLGAVIFTAIGLGMHQENTESKKQESNSNPKD